MDTIARIYFWYILKRTLVGRNRDRERPEAGRITVGDIRKIIDAAITNYHSLIINKPYEKTIGSRIMVRDGIWSLALYRAMKTVAVGEGYATELCTDAMWKMYINNVGLQRLLARIVHRDPQKQMNMIQRMFLRFPLSAPGYICHIKEMDSVCSYDITRCPVCDYYTSLGGEALAFFRNSWCTLDFPLAEYLVKNGRYERPHTLSHGHEKCDMRWMTARNNM